VQRVHHKIILLSALGCLVLLFVGGPGPDAPRSLVDLWDLGHLFCFALWTWLYLEWRPRQNFWSQLLFAMGLAFAFGGLTEIAQSGVGRDASWADLQKDLLGCLLIILFLAPSRKQLQKWFLRTLQFLVVLMVFWNFHPLVLAATDEVIAWRQFPLLAGFETPLERERWGGNSQRQIAHDIVHSGKASLRVKLNTDRYSGVSLRHFPADWTDFKLLRLQVYNPDMEPLKVYFRIHDQLHRDSGNAYRDRFNTSFTLRSGWSLLEIPLEQVATAPRGRKMEMKRIAGMILFVGKLEQPKVIYIDDVELVR